MPNRKSRLLMLTTYLTDDQAGASKAFHALCKRLSHETELEVTLACVRQQGLDLVHIPLIEEQAPRFFWRLPSIHMVSDWKKSLMRANLPPADVVYSNSMYLSLAYRALNPETALITHTGAVLHSQEVRQEYEGPALLRACEEAMLNRLEAAMYAERRWIHITSTPLVAKDRSRYFGIPEDQFRVVPYGIDPEKFPAAESRMTAKHDIGLNPAGVAFVTVARLVNWKRIDMGIQALADIGGDSVYLVVGDGPARVELQALAVDLKVAERVRFLGWCSPLPYLQAADTFVLPSEIESFGLAYAEAMMTGLPIIGRKHNPPAVLSSAQDLIADGNNGFVVSTQVELTARMKTLSEDAGLRMRMGEASRRTAHAKFTVTAYVNSLRALIDELA